MGVGNTLAAAGIDVGKGCAANPGTCYSVIGEARRQGSCWLCPSGPAIDAAEQPPAHNHAGLRDDEIKQLTTQNSNTSQEWIVVKR